jgi:hypothetical protein
MYETGCQRNTEFEQTNKKKNLWLAFGIATWEGLINEYFVPGIFALLLY